jgi:hypothetical protein
VVFCAVIFGLNIISTRFFAEGEFWFSLVKVITTGTCGNQYCIQKPAAVKLEPSATVHVSQ